MVSAGRLRNRRADYRRRGKPGLRRQFARPGCAEHYRSCRSSDNSWQPNSGPRQQCNY
ncbi:BA14K family protein [Mesorhizobium sp. B2-3-4]|uniref:BA14K family protein n=1 Tax=Mesorhizobium sp. B2-3-4 TaxID=2589959 RepID=UPI001FEF4E8A|nr:BA14K family protein [Mesorhizobium sp. B2-3-4]